jgi:hypothetical protein
MSEPDEEDYDTVESLPANFLHRVLWIYVSLNTLPMDPDRLIMHITTTG